MYSEVRAHSTMRVITYWLSLGMIFIIPWEGIAYLESVGTASRIAGLAVAGFWILTVLVTGSFRWLQVFHVVTVLFVLWNGMSVAWSLDPEVTWRRTLTYLQLCGMVVILWDIYTTPSSIRTAMQAYVLGAFVTVGSVLNVYLSASEELRRYAADDVNSNAVGLILALGIPIAWYLALFEKYRLRSYWLRLLNYAYIPSAFVGIMLTGSRAAIFGLLPVPFFMLATLGRIKIYQRVLLLGLAVATLLALIPVIPESTFNRIAATRSEVAGDSTTNRLTIWYEGARIFADNPVLGVGSGAFRSAAVETGKSAHNFALTLLAELGTVGFGLFMAVLAIAAYQARLLPKPMAWLWLTVFLIWFLGALTHSWEHMKATWLFLGLTVCAAAIYGRRTETALEGEIPTALRQQSPAAGKSSHASSGNISASRDGHSTT